MGWCIGVQAPAGSADHARSRSHVQLTGKVIPAGTAQRVLFLLSEVLGAYGDVPRVNELHKLANLLYSGYSGFLHAHEEVQIDYYDYLDSQGP